RSTRSSRPWGAAGSWRAAARSRGPSSPASPCSASRRTRRTTSTCRSARASGSRSRRRRRSPTASASRARARSRSRSSRSTRPTFTRRAPPSAAVEGRDDLGGQALELLQHPLGRSHRPEDELRPAAGDVLLEPLAHDFGGAERGARGERRLVDAAARDEGRGERARPRGIVVEPEVQQRAEVVARHLAPRLGREGARLLDARAERLGRDERRDPAVAEAARAPHRGLAVAADPDGQGLLHGPGEHRDALEFPEFAVEGDLALTPAAAHDLDRLVGPAAALLEGHGCRLELTLLLDAD